MGVNFSKKVDFKILVKTGDVKGAGTDSNVYCILIDKNGARSDDILLDVVFRNDFEKGNVDVFKVKNVSHLDEVTEIILKRDESGINDDWFVEYIKVIQFTKNGDDMNGNEEIPFPCNRWVYPNKDYKLLKYDSVLPQFDTRVEQRKLELESKQDKYKYGKYSAAVPRRVDKCPTEENFSNDYQWDIITRKAKMLAEKKIKSIFSSADWKNLGSLVDVYKGSFGVPYGYYNWKSDRKFGQQRLRGCNPMMINLCTEIPEKFAVTNEMLSTLLEGLTIEDAIKAKQLYIIDLEVLHDLECKDKRDICAPIALFFRNGEGDLLPVAIQLRQQPADDNPVFLPTDAANTWLLAKMFYNNAECCVHQTCTHLGFTHLVVESLSVATHLTLSPSHPVFRLVAPHFLYLIAINTLAVSKLLSEDGWIDITMTMGVCGLYNILERKWSDWRLDREGWLPNDLKARGVEDAETLPGYLFRDDALMLHNAIYDYVSDVLNNIYDTEEKLLEDTEIQAFAAILTDCEKGPGIKGVFGDGKFNKLDDLIKTITSTIYISSVMHAAANFCQYDEYAFPPNYPATLSGVPPTDKEDKYTDEDVLNTLPSKDTTLSIMVVTKLLSERGTNGLGDFEIQYQYEPHAVQAVERFRSKLDEISEHIRARNLNTKEPYPYLDPREIPNAISI